MKKPSLYWAKYCDIQERGKGWTKANAIGLNRSGTVDISPPVEEIVPRVKMELLALYPYTRTIK